MDEKLDIFYFSSTHWDREWYQTFQAFRYRLVNFTDELLELMDNDPEYKTFHFDGQSIVLEDYCEISPENKGKLQNYIKNGRIVAGPWYVMPDEFLVSGESLIRNLMLGHKITEEWGGKPWKYGYVCDIFGHIAQLPQIFRGFDIKYAALGRGTTESEPGYFIWKSPDGSECFTYKLDPQFGYGSFRQRIGIQTAPPEDNPEVEQKLVDIVTREYERTGIPIVVLMDGLDHAPADPDTTTYLRMLAKLFPNANIHHANLCEQGEMLEKYREALPVTENELSRTARFNHSYLHLITNTLSSYYPLKKKNDECQNLLEKTIEPLCVLSMLEGKSINRSFVKLAYKYLLQNHPHDSICGCSIDQVHKDMEYRFDQVVEIADEIKINYLYNDRAENSDGDTGLLTLYNTLGVDVEKTVSVEIDFDTDYRARYAEPFGYEHINSFKIYDSNEIEVPYIVTDIKRNYKKRLIDGNIPLRDVHTVTFKAFIPSFGKAYYKVVPCDTSVRYLRHMKSGLDYVENEHIRVDILPNGALKITDKKTNRVYNDLCNIVDDAEIGDGWYHAGPVNNSVISTKGGSCSIEKAEDGPSRCVFKVTRYLEVPEGIKYTKFNKIRSDKKVKLELVMYVILSEDSRYVEVKLEYDNIAKDHRMRMFIPTDTRGDKYFAGQAFYCCERKPGIDFSTQEWLEHDQYEKSTNGIVGKRDDAYTGIALVAKDGIHECAAYDDEHQTLSVTLLRSFSTTQGTNGESRCQINRKLSYEFALAVLDSDVSYSDLLRLQNILAYDIMSSYVQSYGGNIPNNLSLFRVTGDDIAVSVVKRPEDNSENTIIVRVFNASVKASVAKLCFLHNIMQAQEVNLNEEPTGSLGFKENSVELELAPWKIVTLKIKVDLSE